MDDLEPPRRPSGSGGTSFDTARSIVGVRIPDTAATRAAHQLARECSSALLYRHAMRSFVVGSLLHADDRYDEEALFVGCILHDLGLTPAYQDPVRPFEVVGADAASELAERYGWSPRRRAGLHRAIVVHMALEVTAGETDEARVLGAGVAGDVTGRRLEELDPIVLQQLFRELPRVDFATRFPDLLQHEATAKPGSAADVLLQHGLLERIASAQHERFAALDDPGGAVVPIRDGRPREPPQ